MITEGYRKLNQHHHQKCHSFGEGGAKIVNQAKELINKYLPESILDYGCGKGAFKKAMKRDGSFKGKVSEYDPAIPGKDALAEPADLVICRDVLEHIEPECLTDVFLDLRRVTKKCLYVVIACRPSQDILKDGTNAHRIIRPPEWWEVEIQKHFNIVVFTKQQTKRECWAELT